MANHQSLLRRHPTLLAVTLIAGAVVVAAAIEGLAHLVDARRGFAAWYARSISYLEDEEVDWVAEPRVYEWTEVNDSHFRGPAIPREKKAGVLRIVVLGGTSTFEIGKADDATWPALLEQRLREVRGGNVEVLNAATPGYSTWQSSRLLRKRVLDWDPDLVLVYHLAEDSAYFRHADRQAIIEGWKLTAHADYIGAIAHEPYPPLAGASRILPRAVDLVRMQLVQRRIGETSGASRAFWVDPTLSGQIQEAGLRFYEENLNVMAEILGDRGTSMVVVTQVSLVRSDNTQREREVIDYASRGLTHERLVAAYYTAWGINREIAERHDHVFLIPAHEHIPAAFPYLSNDANLTGAGSRMLANYIAAQLVQQGILR